LAFRSSPPPIRRPAPFLLGERCSLAATYLLWALGLVGICGLQRFYARRPRSGLVLLLTFGFCGIGQIVDLFLVPKLVEAANRQGPPPLDRQLLALARRRGEAGFTLNDALLDLQHDAITPVQQVREEIERLLLEHLLDVGNDERGRIVYREP
jgi:hypothetical protein